MRRGADHQRRPGSDAVGGSSLRHRRRAAHMPTSSGTAVNLATPADPQGASLDGNRSASRVEGGGTEAVAILD
jgi:hypothetical protein